MIAKPSTSSSSAATQSLSDWVANQLAPSAHVQMRLRGNVLHVLSETPQPLHQSGAITRLVEALLAHPLGAAAVTSVFPQAYQLYIYSRQIGKTQPDWTAPIYLNRLERHQAQLQHQASAALKLVEAVQASQAEASAGAAAEDHEIAALSDVTDDGTTAIVLSHLSLAKQGDADAIAWYLSEVLSTLDVGVWVSVRAASRRMTQPREAVSVEAGSTGETPALDPATSLQRLWVWCEATYSPDPLLIAEPVTERLRQLSLTQFKDAVIVIQVHGEDVPDWSLRIDLTPAADMLWEWGRWGDEGAIARLLDEAVRDCRAAVAIERKDESLHAIVSSTLTAEPPIVPVETDVMEAIAPLLADLAPQGVHRLMVYGQAPGAETPDWVRCLNLPALEHEELAPAPTALAKQGDLAALAYLLTRLLNPDLEAQLATGGIRIQVLQRDQLLHVMADGPICPTRRQVVPQVLDFLDFLSLTYIAGVRLYGRRAGQQRPAWSFGKDFQARPQLVPKTEPIFAVSDRYIDDLLSDADAATSDADEIAVGGRIRTAWQKGQDQVRQFLCDTQLLLPYQELPQTPPQSADDDHRDAVKIGLVWATVGLLLALQADWIFGQIINPGTVQGALEAATAAEAEQPSVPVITAPRPDPSSEQWERSDWDTLNNESLTSGELTADETAIDETDAVFNDEALIASPERSLAPTPDLLTRSPYPSFRSQQMDEKLALYHQHLAESGTPDVLVIGSSRALRGIDPAALKRELAALGYGDLSVFNFGVNGATAQVVDLTVRRVLQPHQLPRLIIWADGARAFNSGRTDVTYNAIAASEGFQELGRRNPEIVTIETEAGDEESVAVAETVEAVPLGQALRDSYQALDETLSEQLGQRSAVYDDRDELKAFVRDRLLTPLVAPAILAPGDSKTAQNTSDMPIPEGSEIDFDGFLALDVRFNPATYYQLYARVAGAYDSDYEDFGLDGEQTAAFEQLLNYTQEQGVPVVFVNTPLTDEYLDGYRSDAEADFQRLMLRYSATEENFIFRDLGQLWTGRYDYFSDPSHLNRYGAYQVSLRLAQDPMISWPRALDLSAAPSDETP
ncbi:MAG: DUF1574 domain-containing protein [Cyanobacteria bacterium P01_C01_bin.120]